MLHQVNVIQEYAKTKIKYLLTCAHSTHSHHRSDRCTTYTFMCTTMDAFWETLHTSYLKRPHS